MAWASYQIRKIAGCACTGNAGNILPRHRFQKKPLVSDPGMHHGTCVTHVPWCMSGSLTCGDGETFPAFPAHAHPQFCVSGKRPMALHCLQQSWLSLLTYSYVSRPHCSLWTEENRSGNPPLLLTCFPTSDFSSQRARLTFSYPLISYLY